MPYNTIPGIDEGNNFPPAVRQSIASSSEVRATVQNSVHEIVPGEVAEVIGDNTAVYQAAVSAVDTALSQTDILTGKDPRSPVYMGTEDDWAIYFPSPNGLTAGGVRPSGEVEFFKFKKGVRKSLLTAVTAIGDSLAASSMFPEHFASHSGLPVTKYAWNGETSDGIGVRAGFLNSYWTISGGSIPASGSVTVTPRTRMDFTTGDTYMSGSFAGVEGRLYNTGNSTFRFERTAAGATTPAAGVQRFTSWPADWRNTLVMNIMGRNDVTQGSTGLEQDVVRHVLGNFIKIREYVQTANGAYMCMGTLNRATEPIGTDGYNAVMKIQEQLSYQLAGEFVDVRSYMVNRAIYDMGITPTSQDLESIQNDCPPWSIMTDLTHPLPEAWDACVNNLLLPYAQGKGYI